MSEGDERLYGREEGRGLRVVPLVGREGDEGAVVGSCWCVAVGLERGGEGGRDGEE